MGEGVSKIFYCENCGNEVLKSYPGGKAKLRTNILIWEEGRAFCKCLQCHAEVPIPVVLELPTGRTLPPGKHLKYFILEKSGKGVKDEKHEK